LIWWLQLCVQNRQFERLRSLYISLLDLALGHRKACCAGFVLFAFASLGLIHFIGSDFFPTVDSGQLRLHARTPAGNSPGAGGGRVQPDRTGNPPRDPAE